MIETKESREEFEKRREKARAAMKAAIRGELPFSEENAPQAREEHMKSEHGLIVENTLCPICEDRKRKARERVKRYRSKK